MTANIFPAIKTVFSAAAKTRSRAGAVWRVAKIATCAAGAAWNLYKLYDLSEKRIIEISAEYARQSDETQTVAAPDSARALRLNRLVEKAPDFEGRHFNFKVYITGRRNASAFADGSVRVDSGLMDALDDDELTFVIGHEIGHALKKTLSKKRASGACRENRRQFHKTPLHL